MQIVKIYPKNKEKCHFSIRKNNNKYFVFEGDKVLREDLDSFGSAETEISLIVLARRKNNVKEVPVSYTGVGIVVNKIVEESLKAYPELKMERSENHLIERNCEACGNVFQAKRSNTFNCSQKCSQKSYMKKVREKNREAQMTSENIPTQSISEAVMELAESNEIPNISQSDLNEFHELTEKQMNVEKRMKQLDSLALDIVEYIVVWCENNKSFNDFQSYSKFFENLVKLKIVNLTMQDLISVMPELVIQARNGSGSVYGLNNFDFDNKLVIMSFRERLVKKIISEQVIPSEEQFDRAVILKLLTSQLYFVKKQIQSSERLIKNQQLAVKEDKFREGVNNKFDHSFDEINKNVNKLKDNLTTVLENQILLSQSNSLVLDELKSISERVTKITQKRKGLFG